MKGLKDTCRALLHNKSWAAPIGALPEWDTKTMYST
jgi:hypothetical protein